MDCLLFNYYDLLQIHSRTSEEAVQQVCGPLLETYHPDQPETGNREKHELITEARRVLTDKELRNKYDRQLLMSRPPALTLFQSAAFGSGVRADLMIRCGILCLLAAKRRESPDIGALNALDLERMMGIARPHLRFAFWYLKSKLYIKQDDRSSMGITAEGLDYLESILAGDELLQKIYLAADTSIHT